MRIFWRTKVAFKQACLLSFQQPFRCEIEHKLGVSCVGSGPVLCRVALDRGGYVPGETIGISATVRNRSGVTIKNTRAALTEVRCSVWFRSALLAARLRHFWILSLLQTIQYMGRGKVVATETRELASLSRGKIRPGGSDDWNSQQLYVPPLPPTNLRGCHLISVQYDVYVCTNIFWKNYRSSRLKVTIYRNFKKTLGVHMVIFY